MRYQNKQRKVMEILDFSATVLLTWNITIKLYLKVLTRERLQEQMQREGQKGADWICWLSDDTLVQILTHISLCHHKSAGVAQLVVHQVYFQADGRGFRFPYTIAVPALMHSQTTIKYIYVRQAITLQNFYYLVLQCLLWLSGQ